MRTLATAILVAAALAATAPAVTAAPSTGKDVAVRVQKDGSTFTVHAEFTVPASVDECWEVLTDYDKMSQIVTAVDVSKVVKRDGNRLEVEQKSHAVAGPLKFSTSSLREVELIPNKEIRSKLLKGDLKSQEFTTRVVDEGAVMRVVVDGKFVVGGLTGAAITIESVEGGTRRQYLELRNEILRRKAKEPPPACLLAKTCEDPST
jgi:hypothetical protein